MIIRILHSRSIWCHEERGGRWSKRHFTLRHFASLLDFHFYSTTFLFQPWEQFKFNFQIALPTSCTSPSLSRSRSRVGGPINQALRPVAFWSRVGSRVLLLRMSWLRVGIRVWCRVVTRSRVGIRYQSLLCWWARVGIRVLPKYPSSNNSGTGYFSRVVVLPLKSSSQL